LPALRPCALAAARTDRELAVLRCIEALAVLRRRASGQLPATLEEIKEVPIPLNPVTGKPFSYRLEGRLRSSTPTVIRTPFSTGDRGQITISLLVGVAVALLPNDGWWWPRPSP